MTDRPLSDEQHRHIGNALRTIALRAGYILGACRGEDEMRAEAKAIIEIVKRLEEKLGYAKGDGER